MNLSDYVKMLSGYVNMNLAMWNMNSNYAKYVMFVNMFSLVLNRLGPSQIILVWF